MAKEAKGSEKESVKWCFTWDPTDKPGASTTKAALENKNKWPKNSTINVAFLDGVKSVQDKIKEVVKAWTAPDTASLKIVFVADPKKADVRISFKHPGSWSTIGTSCRNVAPATEPTMNYGWLTPTTAAAEVRRVVLHEFGHALGLIHEHQNPTGAIPWNKPNVIRDLSGPPNNWSKATIEHNMFEVYKKQDVDSTKVDTKSIMIYPIPVTWVTDPKFAAGLNNDLSPTDKTFIHAKYPK